MVNGGLSLLCHSVSTTPNTFPLAPARPPAANPLTQSPQFHMNRSVKSVRTRGREIEVVGEEGWTEAQGQPDTHIAGKLFISYDIVKENVSGNMS